MTVNEATEYVAWAYQLLLDRAPDPEGESYWVGRLLGGLSKEEFLQSVTRSDEYAARRSDPGVFAQEASRWAIVKELNCDLIVPITEVGANNQFAFRVPARDLSVTQGLIDNRGMYERHVTRFLTSVLSAGDTFVDIGANLGFFTVLGARLVGEGGEVLAFEPVTINRRYCQANMELNNIDNTRLFPHGLWSSEKVLEMATWENFQGGSHLDILPPEVTGDTYQGPTEQITCVTLDGFAANQGLRFERLKAIKMDIEGAEPFALDGMAETIRAHKPLIVLEINRPCLRTYFQVDSDAIWQRLVSAGYTIAAFPEQCVAAAALPRCTRVEGLDLRTVQDLETLNRLCPEDSLIDIVAIP
ncbi:MAG TPA: FkbM family methyltransferase [Ktedonobacterales bacterium]